MQRRLGAWFVAIVVVAALAPAFAAGRAIADEWIPVGDNAAIAIHARDVFSSDSPLLGMRTTLGGTDYAYRVRHPGPLEFWVLAIPQRLAGTEPWGIVVGVAIVAIAALLAIAWAAARVAGLHAAVWALAIAVVGSWSLGRQLLADPWNPYISVLPLAAMLFLTWAAIAGDAWALPPLAFAASFVAQTHVLGVPIALTMLAGATVAVVVGRTAVRQLTTTAVVLSISWLFPLWDQLVHRPGNVVELSRAYRADETVGVGWTYAFRAIVRAIGVVPLFARPARNIGYFGTPVSAAMLATAIAVVAVLIVGTVSAVRRRDRLAASAGAVALTALAVVAATTAQIPFGFPDVAFYRVLHLWPLGMFVWFASGLVTVRAVTVPLPVRRASAAVAAATLVVAAPAVAFADSRLLEDERYMKAVVALARDTEQELEGIGPVRVRATGELYAAVLYGMVYELRRHGVDARVDADDPYVGYDHAAPDDAPILQVVGNDMGERPAAGARRVAEYRGWSDADRDRLDRLDRDVRELLDASGIPELRGRDPYLLYRDATLLRLEIAGDLVLDADEKALLEQYRELRFRIEELTLAAYLMPPD